MATIKQNLARSGELEHSDSARLDAEVLLAHLLGKTRTWLYTWPEYELGTEEQQLFDQLLARRAAGEPVAHIVGRREFWSLDLKVDTSTLIPRPETELLVETALELCPQEQLRALDLGTGSGAIALALATERPGWHLLAVDRSAAAVALADENRRALGLENVEVRQSDWFSDVPRGKFGLIVSNPPYIDAADPHLQQGDVRFEPRSALVAERGGFADIERIATACGDYLENGGWLVVEHGWQQAAGARRIFTAAGLHEVSSRNDYSGRERLTLGRK
ncbi:MULTISPECIES: peptide chain release factor N(5)-glutamine methyltransferase [Microbulbifer]|uniref:peptide chain release factor N(5)-glutamine methyltransferase n=1 Tax=Microbulbifer TaxID=48073 RepID=UPI001E2E2185|nr:MULTISPECIES: peptide chain release factor N(5)-glutamine methyltransferase [Microbulbifer]UHQ56388.1 peptide chain release factor N(5)-glutamine methyltransferase [Microbulbifer sp. YPW16]